MVRRKIEIKPIEDKCKQHTTFCKRRQALHKKTEEYCGKSDAVAAVISISKSGNFFGFGYPNFDRLLDRYITDPTSLLAKETEESAQGKPVVSDGKWSEDGEGESPPPLMETEKRIIEAMESGNWDVAVRDLEMGELGELEAEVEKISRRVEARRLKIVDMGKKSVPGRRMEIEDMGKKSMPAGGFSGGD